MKKRVLRLRFATLRTNGAIVQDFLKTHLKSVTALLKTVGRVVELP